MLSTIRIFLSIFYAMGMVTLIGCATSGEKECPTVEQSAVSACRAELKCKQEKTTYGVGLGVGKATDSGIVGTRTIATTDNYTSCIQRDLDDQRAQKRVIGDSPELETE